MNEVEIELRDEEAAVFRFPDGSRTEGKLLEEPLSRETLDWFGWYLERVEERQCSRRLLRLLGRQLFRALFADPTIRAKFETFCAAEHPEPRQVRLEFRRDAMALARMPWEFMYVEQQGYDDGWFLAERSDLVLVRYVEWQDRLQRGSQQLRVLLVVQSPQDKTSIATQGLQKLLTDLVGKKGDAFTRQVEHNLDWQEIRRIIGEFKPDVFHFAGHGSKGAVWLAQAETDLQTEGDDAFGSYRRPQPIHVDHNGVAELFRFHTPRLVVLDACESAAETAALPSLAHAVLKNKVQAVVAMRYKISNLASERFNTKLYSRIAAGARLDVAVQEARVEIGTMRVGTGDGDGGPFSDRAFGTPVLYLDRAESMCDPLPDQAPAQKLLAEVLVMPKDEKEITCPRCKESQPLGRFCVECGRSFRCPNAKCDAVFSGKEPKFCPTCRHPVPQAPPYLPPDIREAQDHFAEVLPAQSRSTRDSRNEEAS